jgi:hypothetical protein
MSSDDMALVVEEEGLRGQIEMGTDPGGNPVFVPALMSVFRRVEPEHDQVGIKLGQGVSDCHDLIL